MLFHAEITVRNEEGVLERVLRVCRHRGFGMHRLSAALNIAQESICIEIEGESERLPFHLMRQIEKLDEVMAVSVGGLNLEVSALASGKEAFVRPSKVGRVKYANTSHG